LIDHLDAQYIYENYREKALSRGAAIGADDSIPPDDIVNRSFKLKEEQLRKEEEKLKEIELRVQREISEKRQELLAREESLRNMEVSLYCKTPSLDASDLDTFLFSLRFLQARLAQSAGGMSPR
jgi:septin family protein